MKKHFNIYIASIFMVLCFFIMSNKVEAADFYCDYKVPVKIFEDGRLYYCKSAKECTEFWKDYTIRLHFSGEKTPFYGFYNTKTDTFYSGAQSSKQSRTVGDLFAKHDLFIDIGSTKQSFEDYWENPRYDSCPQIVTYVLSNNSDTEDGIYIMPYDIYRDSFQNENNKKLQSFCNNGESKCGTLAFISSSNNGGSNGNSGSNGNGGSNAGNIKFSCSYTQMYTSEESANYFTMNVGDAGISFNYGGTGKNYGDESDQLSVVNNFTSSELGNSCPGRLYGRIGTNGNEVVLFIEKPSGSYDYKFRNVQVIPINDTETIDPNASLNVSKTLKYIKMAYGILRFLVPTLIIVFSMIEFLTVVFSGDAEKMQKAKKRFVLRIVIGVLFLFIPLILELILRMAGIIGSKETLADVTYEFFK